MNVSSIRSVVEERASLLSIRPDEDAGVALIDDACEILSVMLETGAEIDVETVDKVLSACLKKSDRGGADDDGEAEDRLQGRLELPQEEPRDGDDEEDPSQRRLFGVEDAESAELEASSRFSETALEVLRRRYLAKDEGGEMVETPLEMFERVAGNIAKAEYEFGGGGAEARRWAEEFFTLMSNLWFLPNSPTLMNAGRELQQLSACFVLPVEDSMESIFTAIRDMALIQKSGGGTGFSFSRIRPRNDRVQSTRGVSSGPISFMKAFDAATETVKQGGTRRGANMAILRVDHPDIMDFIRCKADERVLNNFNISVGLTEEFMQAVVKDGEYPLVNPRNGEPVRLMRARAVFDEIVQLAWRNGEPGIVFLDRMERDNPTPHLGTIEATNPCGEQPLLPYESCNLGSVNLSAMVRRGEDGTWGIDYDLLRRVVRSSVRFLDNVIEMNRYPLPQIERMTRTNRKIGLGVMGWADLLIRLGIPYGSPESFELAGQVMEFVDRTSKEASMELAAERGSFPAFEESVWPSRGFSMLRNATTTTIAPTGTISIIAGVSSGIEPLFSVVFTRRILDGDDFREVHPIFAEKLEEAGILSDALLERIEREGSLRDMMEIPEHVRGVFVTARDVSPEGHVRMQAVFQRHVDNAVSKTVNFPASATCEDIRVVYMLAYELGCKGVTVYRDGSRSEQVLSSSASAARRSDGDGGQQAERPEVLHGYTYQIRTSEGKFYVTINEKDGKPFEVFSTPNSRGREAAVNAEALCRLVSLALRHGVDVESIHEQLVKVRNQSLLSLPHNIARVLAEYMRNHRGDGRDTRSRVQTETYPVCPECGGFLVPESGCESCHSCGFSRCS